MSSETLELERDIGQATIVYEDPEEGPAELTVENEQIAYFQDHWTLKAGEDGEGNDVVRRIPEHKVYYVDRSVEEFEEEVRTIRNQVQSFAEDIRTKLPIGGRDEGDGERSEGEDGDRDRI